MRWVYIVPSHLISQNSDHLSPTAGRGLLPLEIAERISGGMRFHGTWSVSGHVFLTVEGDPQSSALLDSASESESTLDGLEKGSGDGLLGPGRGCGSVCCSKVITLEMEMMRKTRDRH